jgi:DNA gyrase subunit B
MSNKNAYDNNSIDQLVGAARIRNQPQVMLGSKGLEGAQHTFFEIVGNATDEHLSGYGDRLDICLYDDGAISVRDYGRGVPLGWNEKRQAWNYFLIYEELYAGGKYDAVKAKEVLKQFWDNGNWEDFNIKDYPYIISVGLHGLGAAATQCSSEYCEVSSYRDGVKSTMKYEKGASVLEELIVEDTNEENGTFVKWKPDKEVFTDVNITAKWLEGAVKTLSTVSGFSVTFNNKGVEKEFPHTTIEEQLKSELGGSVVFSSKFYPSLVSEDEVGICYVDIALGEGSRSNDYFHNMVRVRGGVHSSASNFAESDFFNKRAKEEEIRLKAVDYSGRLSCIISTLSNIVSYRGQTKDSLDDHYVYKAIEKTMTDMLIEEWDKQSKWLVDLVDDVMAQARNRIAIEALSKDVKSVEKTLKTSKPSEKFKSCDAYEKKDYNEAELWIFEGDSAGTSGKNARDSRYQCILPIRGKSLNVFKATIPKILANTEIKDIATILGCGVDLGLDEVEFFDINKLKVGKVIIGADADIDGMHIRMLVFLIFYKLFPELLYNGLVYVADTPKFVIVTKNDESIYCLDDNEVDEKRQEIGSGNIKEITRFKGLGEMNPDQLWSTTMNPDSRQLTQIKIDKNDLDIYNTLEVLFGKSTDRRKKAILGSMMGATFDDVMENIFDMVEYIDTLGLSDVEYEEVAM